MSVLLWVQLVLSVCAVAAVYVVLRSIVVIGPAEVGLRSLAANGNGSEQLEERAR